jgi:hypothetical protein
MKSLFSVLFLASTLAAGTAHAQPAPFNEEGVTMGHWHLLPKRRSQQEDFLGMGGELIKRSNAESVSSQAF